MPAKPTKWGIKVWCLTDSVTKYVWTFEVYGGAQKGVVLKSKKGEAQMGENMVLKLSMGLHGVGRVIVIDNFFLSLNLFEALRVLGTYATGTKQGNRIGLPAMAKAKKMFAKMPQGTIAWKMHASRSIACLIWVDKKSMLLISTSAPPLVLDGGTLTVPRFSGSTKVDIPTSPIHHEYTTYMRGVDVPDQLRESYSTLPKTHKCGVDFFFSFLIHAL